MVCFNDENAQPEDKEKVLISIKQTYGRDLYILLSMMTKYNSEQRPSLYNL